MAYNYINYRYFAVRFDEGSRTFDIYGEKQGKILDGFSFTVHTNDLNHVYKKITPADYSAVSCAHEKHLDSNGLSVCFSGGPEELPFLVLRVILSNNKASVSLETYADAHYYYDISGHALWGVSPETDTFAVYSDFKGKGLRCAVGPAAGRGCDSLFDRLSDSLLTLTSAPKFSYDYTAGAYSFIIRGGGNKMCSFDLSIKYNYMAEKFALRYKPMNNNTVFKSPPVGWMTWYAVKFDACEKAVLDNTEVQLKKLKAYGANAVWVDWEWYHPGFGVENPDCDTFTPEPSKYPNGLKYIADKIKEAGFIPCIWIGASHDVRETDFIRKNPETILIKRKSWCGDYWFDPTHPKYLGEFIPRVFKQLTEDWGYEAIKWDALPRALDYFDQYHDDFYDPTLTSEQAMRAVVKKAREIVGDDVYMLSCHGEASRDLTMYADVFDAARIGADIFSWSNYLTSGVDRIFKFYPLHNVVQYCDPDNLVIREEFNTYDQAVSRASLFSLLGTPITLGDDLTKLSDDRLEIIRRAIPTMNVHPMTLDSRLREEECSVITSFVKTPFDEYQLENVMNFTERELEYELKLSDIDLEPETEYLVYDYWNKTFIGKVRHSLKLTLRPCESRVLSIRPALGRPQFVATDRHITQGAYDIVSLDWNKETKTLSGRSHTVAGEKYTVTAYDPAADKPVLLSLMPSSDFSNWEIVF